MGAKPFHLGWFLGNSFGVHGWRQPWAGTSARDWCDPTLQIEMAQALERACFDFMLLEDSSFVPDNYGSSMDYYLKRAMRAPKNDPLPLVPLLHHATRRIGIVPTISTSFYPPFLAARLIATLDLMSGGRAGANFVTSTAARAAQNFGLDEHFEHDLRYEMAEEFTDVVKQLWASWEHDAVVMEEEGDFVDPAKVHAINFKGRFFKSRGPLNTAVLRRGSRCWSKLAIRRKGRRSRQAHRRDACGHGRRRRSQSVQSGFSRPRRRRGKDPETCKVMFVASPTLGETREEARERYARQQAARAPDAVLAAMGSLVDIDFAPYDLDAPLGELTTNGQQGTFKRFLSQGGTLREIANNYRYGLEDFVGTPDDVAAQMEGRHRGDRRRRLHDKRRRQSPLHRRNRRRLGPRAATARTSAQVLRASKFSRQSARILKPAARKKVKADPRAGLGSKLPTDRSRDLRRHRRVAAFAGFYQR